MLTYHDTLECFLYFSKNVLNIFTYLIENLIFAVTFILIFLYSIQLLLIIRNITFCFITANSLLFLSFPFVRCTHEYSAVAWN